MNSHIKYSVHSHTYMFTVLYMHIKLTYIFYLGLVSCVGCGQTFDLRLKNLSF